MAARVSHPNHPEAVRTIAIVLAVAALAVIVPMWAPLVLAAWFAHLTRPLLSRLESRFGKRRRAAGLLVMAAVLLVVGPLVLIVVSMISNAIDMVHKVMQSPSGANALRAIVSPNGESIDVIDVKEALGAPDKVMGVARQYGGRAWTTLQMVAGATARGIIGIFVFLFGAYSMLVDGGQAYRWARNHAPIRPELFDRLAHAFNETGRGLLVGIVLTGAVQAGIATIAYVALGVPSALVLGVITLFASLIPSIGTGLVWAPVAAGLALSGRVGAAIAMLVVGLGVVSMIDNFLRPYFARYGKLDLPAFVVLVAMFGGLALFGAWGLALGPLLVRLFVEALRIAREERMTGAHTTLSPPAPGE
ncbi:MAG: AI-2E family transporter [Deltaproteobacteria bacterium]|nr:AI-2E family transporter [Deltaproteobacteria bacterium]